MAEYPVAADSAARLRRDVATFFDPRRWRTPLPDFAYSGYALIERVRQRQPRSVVGCGDEGSVDVVLALGCINFGTADVVEAQLRRYRPAAGRTLAAATR